MSKTILLPLASSDFDPTEVGVPWKMLTAAGHRVVFATEDGRPGLADPRMVTGEGLGPCGPFLKADPNGRAAFDAMIASPEFVKPVRMSELRGNQVDALVLHGGHAPGMRAFLESAQAQRLTVEAFAAGKVVGAICHGVVVAARAIDPRTAKSVLHGRRTTSLTGNQELFAWWLTRSYLGDYYRTYPNATVQDEVTRALARPGDYVRGPFFSSKRDSETRLSRGFVVRDGQYISARWPGDAHRFAAEIRSALQD